MLPVSYHFLDIEIQDSRAQRRPNYVALRVAKPPAVDWLGTRADKDSAVTAVTNT